MCFKSKGSSQAAQQAAEQTAAEQAKQEAAAAEAKAAAQAEAEAAQKAAIEAAKAEAIEIYKAEQEAKRQEELNKTVTLQEEVDKTEGLSAAAAKEREETLALIKALQENQKSLIASQQSYMKKQTEEAEAQKEKGPAISMAAQRQQRISKFGSIATRGRASRRSGSRSRRSLITGLGGGIGYYDRFAS